MNRWSLHWWQYQGSRTGQGTEQSHCSHMGAWSNLNANFGRHSTSDVHLFCVIKKELCIFHIKLIIWVEEMEDNGHYSNTGPFGAGEVGTNWKRWIREIKSLSGRKLSMFILRGEFESLVSGKYGLLWIYSLCKSAWVRKSDVV